MTVDKLLEFFDVTYADLTAYLGLAAIGILSCNIILGLCVSMAFDARRIWPYRNIQFFNLHNWSGYVAVFVTLLHPASLLLSKKTKFGIFDILFPINAPFQALENSIGAFAAYSLFFVVGTSYLRNRFQFRFWKMLHFSSYALAIAMYYHGIFTDPSLADKPVDYLDGGKIFTEACFLMVLAAILWRIRLGFSKKNLFKSELIVKLIKDESSNVKTFFLTPKSEGSLPFRYKPGQYLTFRFSDGLKRFVRSYSLSSSPTEKNTYSISIKLTGGDGSQYFHETVKEGSVLHASGPYGDFTFQGGLTNSVLLIAGGIGITPLFSILKYLVSIKWPRPVLLIYCAKTNADLVFKNEIESCRVGLPNFRTEYLLSEDPSAKTIGHHGLRDENNLKQILQKERFSKVYICGPDPMMSLVKKSLENFRYKPHQIHTESFGRAIMPAVAFSTVDSLLSVKGHADKVYVPKQTTILEALHTVDIDVNSSCRQGSCGACKIRVLRGGVKQSVDGFLSKSDLKAGYALACVSYCQQTDIEISLENK